MAGVGASPPARYRPDQGRRGRSDELVLMPEAVL
jgi:hypothetical protein